MLKLPIDTTVSHSSRNERSGIKNFRQRLPSSDCVDSFAGVGMANDE
jgi:hypothetical protein